MQSKLNSFSKKAFSSTQKLTISGISMALYIALMYFTQGFAFNQFQIRIATALYSLTALFPFLIVPLGLSNLLSNAIMGALGIFDILGGFFVGIITASVVYLIKRYKLNDWFIAFPLVFGPGLIVPIWLSKLLNIPYSVLAISLCVGQILPAVIGVLLVKQLRKSLR